MPQNQTHKQLLADRKKKLELLKNSGINPYPSDSKRTLKSAAALLGFNKLKKKEIVLSGRIIARRGHGGMSFVDMEDESGKIQVALKKDSLGEKDFTLFVDTVERGDFVEFKGTLFLTRAGEKTLEVKKWRMLAKALRPLPEKWKGLKNEELRYRKRYLDLIINKDTRERFGKRSHFITLLRNFLLEKDFLEVETPILQQMAGGAIAKPFKTRHNALGQDFYLRIAPELYLKRLIVGGFEKVFEFSRNFRNEGISPQHNPDFTMLEFYMAYCDYEKLMRFTEEMLKKIIPKINGSFEVKYQGKIFDFKPPFKRVSFSDLVKKELGIDVSNLKRSELEQIIKKNKLEIGKISSLSDAKLLDEIYKKLIRPNLHGPLFLIDYPKEMIPLAKEKDSDPKKIATFQLVVDGWEIIKAYNELNDPEEQSKRFLEQEKSKKKGDEEAHSFDEDYIEALSYGMPPTAGWGMGIDRFLVILLDQKNIRDVILFPLRRKKD